MGRYWVLAWATTRMGCLGCSWLLESGGFAGGDGGMAEGLRLDGGWWVGVGSRC
jgi:hypothetical protein